MIEYIKLENFAIINKITLFPTNGFNVITGETGAGKSIVIDAISIACGERTGVSVIGTYSDICKIEILFDISEFNYIKDKLQKYNINTNKLKVYREIHSNGKSTFKLNDNIVNAQTIKDITSNLIDIHGQHEHQNLFNSQYHLNIIDNLNEKTIDYKNSISNLYNEYKVLNDKLDYLKNHEHDIAIKLDLYSFQLNEIDNSNLYVGEDEELEKEYEKLKNIEKLKTLLQESYDIINSENGISDCLNNINNNMTKASSFDEELDKYVVSIDEVNSSITDISYEIRNYLGNLEDDPLAFENVSNRLDLIKSMKKKYSMTIEEIFTYRNKIAKELENYSVDDFNTEKLEYKIKQVYSNILKESKELSEIRINTARKFEKKIEENLQELAMPNAKFEVSFTEKEISKDGIDDVEFLISPNLGMPVMPLRKIASGGELSRVSLAIIVNSIQTNPTPLLIFDEIDAGIGGVIGDTIGNKLREISKNSQVICVTHLPQIASKANKQFNVEKIEAFNSTLVNINELNPEERVVEIARMFGDHNSTTALSHAKEILNNK